MHIWHILTTPDATYSKSPLAEQSFCSMRPGAEAAGFKADVAVRWVRNNRVDNHIKLPYYYNYLN